jgi:hypothetical protein
MEDAEWHLEGLLNYEEANNEHNWHGLEFENRTYEVPVSNGQISSNDLNLAYESFLAEINSLLNEDENFRSDMVNINIEENQMKDGTATVGMTYSFGSITEPYSYAQFGLNEYWIWGDPIGSINQGSCYPNPITSLDFASDRLEYRFNHPLASGMAGYYTAIDSVEKTGTHFLDDPGHPLYPDRFEIIYYDREENFEECLSPVELNYYLNKFDHIKELVIPSNKNLLLLK